MEDILWHRGRKPVQTTSSVLVSSSPYLNDARIREWISTEALRRNGPDYPFLFGLPTLIQALDEVRDEERINRLFAEERARNPELDSWFSERFVSHYTKADLERQPPGSIGRILYEAMEEYGFEMQLDPRIQANPEWQPSSDFEYWNLRSGQTHDFDHVLAEVGFDFVAEVFPAFFRIGNYYRHLNHELAGELSVLQMLIIWPWFMRTVMHYPQCWPAFWDGMAAGYASGQASDPIYMVRYEDMLHLSPSEVREKLGMREIRPADTRDISQLWSENVAVVGNKTAQ